MKNKIQTTKIQTTIRILTAVFLLGALSCSNNEIPENETGVSSPQEEAVTTTISLKIRSLVKDYYKKMLDA